MTVELYHYVHCPFCLRVRFALGFLEIPFKSTVLPYDDETTPLALTGVKMLPILKDGNHVMNESLDIIAYLDKKETLSVKKVVSSKLYEELNQILSKISSPLHSLAMPYWIYTAEFNEQSRLYFQKKKEVKRGPFRDLLKDQKRYLEEMAPLLKGLEEKLTPYYLSNEFSLLDIIIASQLWGLYVVPEFQFSEKMHYYLQTIKAQCRFDYHSDFRSIV